MFPCSSLANVLVGIGLRCDPLIIGTQVNVLHLFSHPHPPHSPSCPPFNLLTQQTVQTILLPSDNILDTLQLAILILHYSSSSSIDLGCGVKKFVIGSKKNSQVNKGVQENWLIPLTQKVSQHHSHIPRCCIDCSFCFYFPRWWLCYSKLTNFERFSKRLQCFGHKAKMKCSKWLNSGS